MKKGKIILGTIAFLGMVAGAFASKTAKFAGTPNIYTYGSGSYAPALTTCQFPRFNTLEVTCVTIVATGYYYRAANGSYQPLPINTKTYTVVK